MSKEYFVLFISLWLWISACTPLAQPQLTATPIPLGPPLESPLIPNQVPVLLNNQWRLTEIIYYDAHRNFDAIDPVLLTFQQGEMVVRACNGIGFYVDTTNIYEPNEYRLRGGSMTLKNCPGGGTEQEAILIDTILATNLYTVEGDKLILSGKNAHVEFIMDNEARKAR